MSSPSRVGGRAPAKNGFWRILKATERSFVYLYDKIWGGGQFALASPAPNSGEGLVPPVIYAHGCGKYGRICPYVLLASAATKTVRSISYCDGNKKCCSSRSMLHKDSINTLPESTREINYRLKRYENLQATNQTV